MMSTTTIKLNINGKEIAHDAPSDISLADFLHEKAGLTGTKVSCGIGICKACTVAVSESGTTRLQRMQACLTPAASLAGYRILTVEGLADDHQLTDAQLKLLQHFSFQCGYCTPGFLMGILLLVDQLNVQPVKREALRAVIEEHVGDHICRCSGYVKYHEAIKDLLETTPGLIVN